MNNKFGTEFVIKIKYGQLLNLEDLAAFIH
jgi:hypothetical protein